MPDILFVSIVVQYMPNTLHTVDYGEVFFITESISIIKVLISLVYDVCERCDVDS